MAAKAAIPRCREMLSGEIISATAVIHVGNGGFSSRGSPFIVGIIQLPSYTISLAVMILRLSIMSVFMMWLLTKNVMMHSVAKRNILVVLSLVMSGCDNYLLLYLYKKVWQMYFLFL